MKKQEGYCVRCKFKIVVDGAEHMTMKNGRPAMRGKCPKCGTTIYKILPKKIEVEP